LENKNKFYNTFYSKHKSSEINNNEKKKKKSDGNNENNKIEYTSPESQYKIKVGNFKKIQSAENLNSLEYRKNKLENPYVYMKTMISITNSPENTNKLFLKQIGTKTLKDFVKKKSMQDNIPDKKINFKYSENYLEKLQSDLSKKIQEKKKKKLSNNNPNITEKPLKEQDFSFENSKLFETSNVSSKLNQNKIEVPYKISIKEEEYNYIKEFDLEDDENKMEKEEELETVFKKNEQNILDMSINFRVSIIYSINTNKKININRDQAMPLR